MDKFRINQHHTTDVKELSINGTTVTSTAAELNILDTVTSTAAELNILDGVTSTAAEINELDVSAVGGAIKLKTIGIVASLSAAEQDTGWDLPAKCVVLDCWVDVTTAEATGATKTIDVGTLETGAASGDDDGFLDGVAVDAEAVVKGEPTAGGITTNQFWDTCTKGALLCTFNQGESGTGGLYTPNPCTTPGDVSVTYKLGSDDFEELVASICILYVEIA